MFVLVIAVYSFIGLVEILPLLHEGRKKDVYLFLLFFIPAFVMSFLLSVGVEFPKPEYMIQKIVEGIIFNVIIYQ